MKTISVTFPNKEVENDYEKLEKSTNNQERELFKHITNAIAHLKKQPEKGMKLQKDSGQKNTSNSTPSTASGNSTYQEDSDSSTPSKQTTSPFSPSSSNGSNTKTTKNDSATTNSEHKSHVTRKRNHYTLTKLESDHYSSVPDRLLPARYPPTAKLK